MRSRLGMKLDMIFRNVVLPAPVPPGDQQADARFDRGRQDFQHLRRYALQFHQRFRRNRASTEPSNRQARPVQRQRRNNGIDARAIRKPRVHHGRGFVHPAPDPRDDAVDHLHQVPVVAEYDIGLFEQPVAFREYQIGSVHQNVGNRGVLEQRFQRSQPEHLIEKIGLDPALFVGGQRNVSAGQSFLNYRRHCLPRPRVVDRGQFLQIQLGEHGLVHVGFELLKIERVHRLSL